MRVNADIPRIASVVVGCWPELYSLRYNQTKGLQPLGWVVNRKKVVPRGQA